MKLFSKFCLCALAVASFAILPTTSSAEDWRLLGTRQVKDRVETDRISLNGHRGYRKLKVCVYRNPVNFKDLDVYFENGGHQDIAIARRINAGNCTRVIDLKGGKRDLDRIVMRYEETSKRRATATVKVFGK